MNQESDILKLQTTVTSLRPLASKQNKLPLFGQLLHEIVNTKNQIHYIQQSDIFYSEEIHNILNDLILFGQSILKLYPSQRIASLLKPLEVCSEFELSEVIKVILQVGKCLAIEISLQPNLQSHFKHLQNLILLVSLYNTSILDIYSKHCEMNIKIEIFQFKITSLIDTLKRASNGKVVKPHTRKIGKRTTENNTRATNAQIKTTLGKLH